MSILVVMLSGAVGLGLAGLAALIWALKSGQFDDPSGAAVRVLDDPDHPA